MSAMNNEVNSSTPHQSAYQHWRLEVDADQILWLYFDKRDSNGQLARVNTVDRSVMEELSHILDDLMVKPNCKALILTSAKKIGFIAGADISQFSKFKDIQEATNLLMVGDAILNKLESLKMPTVAMIDGFCLGGGMEIALACHYRVVEESNETRLGLPEVKLGIHPGWGGTVRLPRLIGALPAMNMVLSGHTISGKAAAKMGLADAAVPRRQLMHAAKYYALNHPARHKLGFYNPSRIKKWCVK